MRKLLGLGAVICLVALVSSCKKVCYECKQHCAYCVLKTDTSIIFKTCANKSSVYSRIDSIKNSYPDSLYKCVLLDDDQGVCDNKNAAPDAIAYYEKEDYFCLPQ